MDTSKALKELYLEIRTWSENWEEYSYSSNNVDKPESSDEFLKRLDSKYIVLKDDKSKFRKYDKNN